MCQNRGNHICAIKADPIFAELHVLRDILMHKYGRDFSAAVMENKDGCVTERVRIPSGSYPRRFRLMRVNC